MRWLRRRLGTVFAADGRIGSGVFLQLPDRRIALLTARHVVAEYALSGEITLQSSARLFERSYAPGALKVAASVDAALIYLPTNRTVEAFLPYAEWAIGAHTLEKNVWVVASGHPGQWKAAPDLVARTIASTSSLHYVSFVRDVTGSRSHLDVIHEARLPAQLGGMSGGPIFDLDRALRGIIVQDEHEGQRLTGIVGVSLSEAWDLLHDEVILPGLSDYVIARRSAKVRIEELKSAGSSPAKAVLVIEYLHHRSKSQPGHVEGTLAIIRRIWCQSSTGARAFEIHVLATVGLDGDDVADECYRVGNQAVSALGLANWAVVLGQETV